MSKIVKYWFFSVVVFGSIKTYAQDYEDDAALWLGINLEKKISDKVSVHIEHKSRINNNFSDYGMGYFNFGGSYTFNKLIKLQAEYSYGKTRLLNGSYSNRTRGNMALILKKKFGAWSISYRNMVQIRYTNIYTSENGLIPKYYNRNKLTIKYELNKRLTPYIAEELYLPFNQTRNKGLDRSRSYIGAIYKVGKNSNFDIYFLYQHELNAFNKTNRDFVYGIGYSHEF